MTLSQSAGPTNPPLLHQTIGDNLEATAARFPDREALVSSHQDLRYTYAEFNAAVDSLALGLLNLDVKVGDRIGIWSPNNAEWVFTQYATAKIGAILVNINPAYRTSELEYALKQSGCRFLDFSAAVLDVGLCLDGRSGSRETSPNWGTRSTLVPTSGTCSPVAVAAWRRWINSARYRHPSIPTSRSTSSTRAEPPGSPRAPLSATSTSLTTGTSSGETCGYTEHDRVCIPVPFYHCFGMVLGNLACTTHGSCMVVPAPGFDPGLVLQAVEEERCTSLYGVPTMFIAELGHENFNDFDLSSLRTGIMAGSPCPVEVMKRVMSDMSMDQVTIAYGMTETSPVSTQTGAADDIERRVSTVGRVHPHVEVRIVDPESGEVLKSGESGEICTSGYSVMLGYWNDPERTAEAVDEDGWMHTGDLGTMDADGYVAVVGRIKDMIIRGGENIYPREIEEFLYTHPQIVDAQVVGIQTRSTASR